MWPGRVSRLCWASAEAGAQSAADGGAWAPAPTPRCACCCWATYAPCSCGCTWSNATTSGCSASVASCSRQLQQAHGSCCRSCQAVWLAGGRSCVAWPLRAAAAPANQCTLLTLPSILALKPACKRQQASRSGTAGGNGCEVQAAGSGPEQRAAHISFVLLIKLPLTRLATPVDPCSRSVLPWNDWTVCMQLLSPWAQPRLQNVAHGCHTNINSLGCASG